MTTNLSLLVDVPINCEPSLIMLVGYRNLSKQMGVNQAKPAEKKTVKEKFFFHQMACSEMIPPLALIIARSKKE